MFDHTYAANDIEHRMTKPNYSWTNGQVERMNRTIMDATVKRAHFDSHDQLKQHLQDFIAVYNFVRRLLSASAQPLEQAAGQAGDVALQFQFQQSRLQACGVQACPGLQCVEADRVVAHGAEQGVAAIAAVA